MLLPGLVLGSVILLRLDWSARNRSEQKHGDPVDHDK